VPAAQPQPLDLRQAVQTAKRLRATAHELAQHAQIPGANMARHWPSERATVHLNARFAGLSRVANRLAAHWQAGFADRLHEPPEPCQHQRRHIRNRHATVIANLPQQREGWCWQLWKEGHGISAVHDWLCLQPDGAYRLTVDAGPRLTLLAACIEAEILVDLAWRNSLEEVHFYVPLNASEDDERIMRQRLAELPSERQARMQALRDLVENWVQTGNGASSCQTD
jgi:hypothetical protein